VDKPELERFRFFLEFDDEELQEIMHKMEQALDTFKDCVYQLEKLGIAKVQRKETANGN